jgi:SAM-dependent methyltransferase
MRRRAALVRLAIAARNGVLDLRYGSLLAGTIRSRYPDLGAFHVSNSEYDDLPHLFGAAAVGADDVIVDVGCGKGRVLNWLLTHHRTNRIVGIELDPDVCAAVKRRLRRHSNVEVLCGDATELIPPEGTLFYLFNPFAEHMVRRFADALAGQVNEPSRVRIVYYHAKYGDVFRADPRFSVEPIDLPSGSQPSELIRLRAATSGTAAP